MRNFGPPTLRAPTPSGPPPLRAPHPSGPPPLRAPLRAPTKNKIGQMRSGQIRSAKIGQMRPNKDGQIRFGQMRSRPLHHPSSHSPSSLNWCRRQHGGEAPLKEQPTQKRAAWSQREDGAGCFRKTFQLKSKKI